MMNRKYVRLKGEITIFLALCAGLLASLILTEIEVSRVLLIKNNQKMAAMIATQAMLAGYTIPLYDRYAIFGIDASARDLSEELSGFLKTNAGYGLLEAHPDQSGIVDQLALTDRQYTPLKKEVMQYMETAGLIDIAKSIVMNLNHNSIQMVDQKKTGISADLVDGEARSEQAKNVYEAQQTSEDETDNAIDPANPTVPEPVEDPRKSLTALLQKGLLSLVLPAEFQVSEAVLPEGNDKGYIGQNYDFTSSSSMMHNITSFSLDSSGFGEAAVEKTILLGYLRDKFRCAVGSELSFDTKLQYELEYLICGHQSDAANLLDIVHQLVMIRCIFNYMYLMTDYAKCTSAHACAEAVSAAMLVPWAEPIVYTLLMLAWAYSEGIADIRHLFRGGHIPMIKTGATWKVSLENIGNPMAADGSDQGLGLDYMDYLSILLLLRPENTLYQRMVTVMETNVRMDANCSGFRMNQCLYSIGCVHEYHITPLFSGLFSGGGGYQDSVLWTECY